jgi:hypothetical protein
LCAQIPTTLTTTTTTTTTTIRIFEAWKVTARHAKSPTVLQNGAARVLAGPRMSTANSRALTQVLAATVLYVVIRAKQLCHDTVKKLAMTALVHNFKSKE